jgi:hypothetical protein
MPALREEGAAVVDDHEPAVVAEPAGEHLASLERDPASPFDRVNME